ncbi:MAG: Uma2 family endonuclease [Treponema sp.]|nr:Uma2 family endonuclease [Treponema sp.]MCL2272149.1 Uma2 family endonuclease [Treponema sp.]
MSALPKEDEFYTYTDYKRWELAEGERFEVIYGEAYAMSAPNSQHQEILGSIFNQFYNYLRGKPCRVYPAPFDVRLFYREDERDDTVVQPDITVICDEKKRGFEGCRGAPDLVIEVLSPSNTAIEMQRKLRLYQDAGVREYWIVDPENKGLTAYRFQEGAILTFLYKKDADVPVGIFTDLYISLEQVFEE